MNWKSFLRTYYYAFLFWLTPRCVKQHYAQQIEKMSSEFDACLQITQGEILKLRGQLKGSFVSYLSTSIPSTDVMSKQKLFQISLAVAGLSQDDIANKLKVSQQAISGCIYGSVNSRRIEEYINTFILEQFKKLGIAIGIQAENQNAAHNGNRFHRAESLSA